MTKEYIPGLLLVLVTRDSVLFAGGLGEANVATHQPVTAHTLFRVGSITKSFVALGLLQLIEQGKLHLTDEVHIIAPEVPIDNPWEATDPVRVVHLLEHTAGFGDMDSNHTMNQTGTIPQGLAGVALFRTELHCRWRPGERMAYSNVGYQVAGYLLEKLSGQPYEQYLTQHLLHPLGMPDATPSQHPATLPQLARGYLYSKGHYEPQLPRAFYAGAAGSMNASAADLARYVQFFLHDGRTADGTALVSSASLQEMETVHSTLAARSGLATGYGLGNYSTVSKQIVFQGHGGYMPSFLSTLLYSRKLGLGYAVSNNAERSLSHIERLVRQYLLRQVPHRRLPTPVALEATEITAYLGHYRYGSQRYQHRFLDMLLGGVSLERRGSRLLLLPLPLMGKADTLIATGSRTFRRPSEPVSSLVLTRDAEGCRVLEAEGRYYVRQASFWWWLQPILLGLSLLLVLMAGRTGFIWLGHALRRQLPPAQVLPRVLLLPAVLALVASGWAHARQDVYWGNLGLVNTEAVLSFVGPLMLSGCTLVGLGLLYRFRQFYSWLAAWYLLFAYGSLLYWVILFYSYDLLGTRTWSI